MTKQVLIIGGGVIGLSAAFECQRRGNQVTLLESTKCGGQASGAAAGMLAPYCEIEEDPDEFFLLCQKSLKLFPEWQKEVKKYASMDFEYNNSGSLYGIFHEADILGLETKMSWQKEFGVGARIIEGKELEKKEPGLSKDIIAALWCPEESHIYAPDYVKALETACRRLGVSIHDQLGMLKINEHNGQLTVLAPDGTAFEGDTIVIATGAWSQMWEEIFPYSFPVFPIRGQICAYNEIEPTNHIIFTSQGYLVSKGNGTLVCGASEDIAGFDTSVTEKGIERLEKWNRKVLPALHNKRPFHKWAGLRPATQDGFPLIGKLSEYPEVIFATGHYRNGILLSPITGKIVANELEGNNNPVPIERFNPERFITL
ncbi:glycine oxidase ThiO [Pseudalkalibacillus caeni]|uniref:glycine oxidase n=1 Tax=Exobacillus caeni TaxID=2574798 RepID=A0A5R9F1L1_9BACL|nr:glycine oxidase ThiO [Pseudalkalibacillus caeni]TLS36330.1 glycine oxidase ThiO [Pseudalkalibacillus caeni]